MTQNIIPLPLQSGQWKAHWTRTKYANLIRYRNGMYYAYAKVGGRKIHKSLETKSLIIAKRNLDALLAEERAKHDRSGSTIKESLTVGELANTWLVSVESSAEFKPMTKRYKKQVVAAIRASWPALDNLRLTKVSRSALESWAERFKSSYSASRFNGALETLKSIFAGAVKHGLLGSNPVHGIDRASVRSKPLVLPSKARFKALLAALETRPTAPETVPEHLRRAWVNRVWTHRKRAALMVRFLAYAGPRISAACAITGQDVDLKRNELVLPPVKYQAEPLRLPMSRDLRLVVVQLLKDYPGSGPLLPVANPRRALASACKEAGISPALTNHDLRRMFITNCLECGVDVATVAKWVGHKDGGSLLLKTYSKIRDEHGHEMMKRVKF